MSLHFFSIPARNGEPEQEALRRFCAGHPVLKVEPQLVQAGADSFWAVAVTLHDGAKGGVAPASARPAGNKIDYKQVLDEAQFTVFSSLRELRKEITQREGVAIYVVFTNEQLAAMVTGRVTTAAALRDIEGVGEARMSKYGTPFLERLRAAFARPE